LNPRFSLNLRTVDPGSMQIGSGFTGEHARQAWVLNRVQIEALE
jgi:hypothetical protein